MDHIQWNSLLDDSIKERVVEQWLWNADIAVELTSGSADLHVIKRSLFACLMEYQKSRPIQCRVYQLLQDLYLLSDKIIDVDEEGLKYMRIIENSLINWAAQADVISGSFQFLAMTFEKEYDNITDLVSTQLLESVYNALNFHRHSKRVQLPGLLMFYQLLVQSIQGSLIISNEALEKIISHVIYNVRFMNDDFGTIKICCSALDIIVRKIGPEALAPFVDELVVLVSDLFCRYRKQAEIESACLLILEKLVVEDRHMMTFCSSSDVLQHICDTIVLLKREVRYSLSVVAAFHLLHQALTDKQLLLFVLDEDSQLRYDCLSLVQKTLMDYIGNIPLYCNSMDLSGVLEAKLVVLVNEIYLEIRDLLLEVVISGAVSGNTSPLRESSPFKEREASYDFERHTKTNNSSDMEDSETGIYSNDSCSISQASISPVIYAEEDVNSEVITGNIRQRNCDETDSVTLSIARSNCIDAFSIDAFSIDGCLQCDSNSIDDDGQKYIRDINENVRTEIKKSSLRCKEEDELRNRNAHEAEVIVEVAQLSQQQAVIAMVRADLLHQLFKDATRKIEVLMKESDGLRTQVGILKALHDDSSDDTLTEGDDTLKEGDDTLKDNTLTNDDSFKTASDLSMTPTRNNKNVTETKVIKGIEAIEEIEIAINEQLSFNTIDTVDNSYQVSGLGVHVGSIISDIRPSSGRSSVWGSKRNTPRSYDEPNSSRLHQIDEKRVLEEVDDLTTVDILRQNAVKMGKDEIYSRAIDDQKGDKRISLSVAGTLEALSVLTCTNSKESRYETAQSKTARKSLLQSGKAMSPPYSAKYDEVDGSYYIGGEAVTVSSVQDLALITLHVFKHIKATEMTSSTGILKQTALSLATLRNVLRSMKVFLMRDVDILFAHLAVTHLSIAGFSYALMACVIKRFPKISLEEVVTQLAGLLKEYWMVSVNRPMELKTLIPGILSESKGQLTPQNMMRLLLALDKEKHALRSIFNAYIEAPRYLSSGSKSREGIKILKMTRCARTVAANHAFITPLTPRAETDINRNILPVQSGVSLMGIAHFSQDFDLSPVVIELPQLFKIFGDVFNKSGVTSISSSSSCSSEGDDQAERDDQEGDQEGGSQGEGERCSIPETDIMSEIDSFSIQSSSAQPYSKNSKVYCSANDQEEPLLSFKQFHSLIIAVALNSSYLQCDSTSVQRVQRNKSNVSSKINLKKVEDSDFQYREAVLKVNRLLTWLNQSRGKDRLTERVRAMSVTALYFRLIS